MNFKVFIYVTPASNVNPNGENKLGINYIGERQERFRFPWPQLWIRRR